MNRVRDQIAVHAAEREPIAFDHQRTLGKSRLDGHARPIPFRPHRLDDFRDRDVDVHEEPLDRLRLDDVPQVVHEVLERLQLALDRAPEHVA